MPDFDPVLIAALNNALHDRDCQLRISDLSDELWNNYVGPLVDEIQAQGSEPAEKRSFPVHGDASDTAPELDTAKTPEHVLGGEIGNTYVSNSDRWVISLIVGYAESDDEDVGVSSIEAAAAAALDLTRDFSSSSTHWYAHDRQTGTTRLLEQDEFEHVDVI